MATKTVDVILAILDDVSVGHDISRELSKDDLKTVRMAVILGGMTETAKERLAKLLSHPYVDVNFEHEGRAILEFLASKCQSHIIKQVIKANVIENKAAVTWYMHVIAQLLAHKNINVNKGGVLASLCGTTLLSSKQELVESYKNLFNLFLHHKHINVNAKQKNDEKMPLLIACRPSKKEPTNEVALKLLLSRVHINPNATVGNQPLLYKMFKYNRIVAVEALLKHPSIEVNKARTKDGATLLCVACYEGRVEAIKLLLAHPGIDVNKAKTDDNATPLLVASQQGHDEVVKLLLAHPGIKVNKACTDDGSTPLFMACQKGHVEVIKLLLAHPKIDVNEAGKDGKTPLYIACDEQYDIIVELLVAHPSIDANIAEDDDGSTPLYTACDNRDNEVVELLLKCDGIDVNKGRIKTDDATPLMIACYWGASEVVELLLKRPEIDLNKRDTDSCTALDIAAENGFEEIVRLLENHS